MPRGSEFTSNPVGADIIDRLLLGENLRRARQQQETEAVAAQQQQQLNDQSARRNEQLLQQAELDQQLQEFELNESTLNALSTGQIPLTDGFRAQDEGDLGLGQLPIDFVVPTPEGTISGQGPRGEVTLSQSEAAQRRAARETQLQETERQVLAEEAGRIQATALRQQGELLLDDNRFRNDQILQQKKQEESLSLAEFKAKQEEKLAKIKGQFQLKVASTRSKGGSGAGTPSPGIVENNLRIGAAGDNTALDIKRTMSNEEFRALQETMAENGFRFFNGGQIKNVQEDRKAIVEMRRVLQDAEDISKDISFSEIQEGQSAKSIFEGVRESVGFPSEDRVKLKRVQAEVLKLAKAIDFRPSDFDVKTIAQKFVSDNATFEENLKRINNLWRDLVDGIKKKYNVNDDQVQIMFEGLGLEEGINFEREDQQSNSNIQNQLNEEQEAKLFKASAFWDSNATGQGLKVNGKLFTKKESYIKFIKENIK